MGNKNDAAVGGSGVITLGDKVFVVKELSIQGEIHLDNRIRLLAKKALGPGGFYKNSKELLEYLAENGLAGDRAAVLKTVADLTATGAGVSNEAAFDFRQSPDGVAEELYWRTRETHPEMALDDFRAVITQTNCLDVFLDIQRAVSPKPKTPSPSSGES